MDEQAANNAFARTRYEYDKLHRLAKRTEDVKNSHAEAPLELETVFSYNNDSLLTLIKDPKQRITTISYDGIHREHERTDPAGNSLSYVYGDNLNVTEIIQKVVGTPGSHITSAEYHNRSRSFDALNRLKSEEDDLGHKKQYDYDLRGNLKFVADPIGVTAFTYDDLNRKRFEHVATGTSGDISKEYRYDDNNRLSQFIDARNQVTTYNYDEADRLRSVQYPSGAVESRQYDAAGNLVLAVDRNLNQVTFNYDANERLQGKTIVLGVGVGGTTAQSFGYDPMNRMTSASDEDSNVLLSIDSRGVIWGDSQKGRNVSSRYDVVANKIRLDYPGNVEPLQRQYHTNIDRLLRIGTIDSNIRQSQWLGIARESDRTLGNGLVGSMNYDSDGRLSEMRHDPAGKIAGFGYQWDSAHFRTAETLHHHNNLTNAFGLDRAHRVNNATLQFADGPVQRNPVFDAADNITVVGGDDVASYIIGNQNQYTSDADEQFGYDANGNLTSYNKGDTSKQFIFDYANRIVSAQITHDGETHELQFEYDPIGRRTARSADGNRTEFIYDGEHILQERNSSGDITREFIWGDGIDELVAIQQDGNTFYAHENSLGSITSITDQTGKVIERYDYDLFGAPVITKDELPPCISNLIREGNELTIEFCEEISETEVTQGDIELSAAVAGDIPFTFAFEDKDLVITPSSALPNEPVSIQVSGIEDLFGNILPTTFTHTFDPDDQGILLAGSTNGTGPVIVDESTIGNPFLFQGREWDPVAQLYYYRARYYDPHLGRFISQDPEGYSDSPNLYQAFMNNPANYADPMGTQSAPKNYSTNCDICPTHHDPVEVRTDTVACYGNEPGQNEFYGYRDCLIKSGIDPDSAAILATRAYGIPLTAEELKAIKPIADFAPYAKLMLEFTMLFAGAPVVEGGELVTLGLATETTTTFNAARFVAIREALSDANGELLSKLERNGLKQAIRSIEAHDYELLGSIKYRGNQGIDLYFRGIESNAGKYAMAEGKASSGLNSLTVDSLGIRQGSYEFFRTRLARGIVYGDPQMKASYQALYNALRTGQIDLYGSFAESGRLFRFDPNLFNKTVNFKTTPGAASPISPVPSH